MRVQSLLANSRWSLSVRWIGNFKLRFRENGRHVRNSWLIFSQLEFPIIIHNFIIETPLDFSTIYFIDTRSSIDQKDYPLSQRENRNNHAARRNLRYQTFHGWNRKNTFIYFSPLQSTTLIAFFEKDPARNLVQQSQVFSLRTATLRGHVSITWSIQWSNWCIRQNLRTSKTRMQNFLQCVITWSSIFSVFVAYSV